MTTRTRPSRGLPLLRFALLLAAAWLGTAVPAEADVTAIVVGTELRVTGDDAPNVIRLLQSIDDLRIEIWVGNSFLVDRPRAIFMTIRIDAGGGDDTVLIDETNGVFTNTEATTILGGDGDDTITAGAGAETIDGGPGNDDITGGRAADTIHGGPGDDHIHWNANAPLLTSTDGADLVNGEAGIDWLEMQGNALAETYSVAPNGDRALVSRGGTLLNIGTLEHVLIFMMGGDDHFTVVV